MNKTPAVIRNAVLHRKRRQDAIGSHHTYRHCFTRFRRESSDIIASVAGYHCELIVSAVTICNRSSALHESERGRCR